MDRILFLIEAADGEIEPELRVIEPQIMVHQSTAPVAESAAGRKLGSRMKASR